jgi:hypothetical protein
MIFPYTLNDPCFRYKGAGQVKTPPVSAPQAIPDASDEAGDTLAKKTKRKSGYQKTILTGDLVPESTGKKTTLG